MSDWQQKVEQINKKLQSFYSSLEDSDVSIAEKLEMLRNLREQTARLDRAIPRSDKSKNLFKVNGDMMSLRGMRQLLKTQQRRFERQQQNEEQDEEIMEVDLSSDHFGDLFGSDEEKDQKHDRDSFGGTLSSIGEYFGGLQNHQYTGGYTELIKKIESNTPAYNAVDQASMEHDIKYSLVTNKDGELEADEFYIQRLEDIKEILERKPNLLPSEQETLDNANFILPKARMKLNKGLQFLSQNQYDTNRMRDERENKIYLGFERHSFSIPSKYFLDKAERENFIRSSDDFIDIILVGPDHEDYDDVMSGNYEELADFTIAGETYTDTDDEEEDTDINSDEFDDVDDYDDDDPRRPRTPEDTPPTTPPDSPRGPVGQQFQRERDREKKIFHEHFKLEDDREAMHWLRPHFKNRLKQLEALNYFASEEHTKIEEEELDKIFVQYDGQGERTERSSRGLNLVNNLAERDIALRYNLNPNQKLFNSSEDYHRNLPLYVLPRDYSPPYRLDNQSRVLEGISYNEALKNNIYKMYVCKRNDMDSVLKNNKKHLGAQPIYRNVMDAPLRPKLEQQPRFPFNRDVFHRTEFVNTMGGQVPATVKNDEDINVVNAKPLEDKWTDAYKTHYVRMYLK